MKGLHFNEYADRIDLRKPFRPQIHTEITKEQLIDKIMTDLKLDDYSKYSITDKRKIIRGKLNTLAPHTLNAQTVKYLDTLLQIELKEKTITYGNEIKNEAGLWVNHSKITVWQGDITTLQTDAITNAANNQLRGCFQPLHACIDNAIHSAAGPQLRDDCNRIMETQGYAEPTGTAKITRAYNLPSKYVLHTVGPIVQGFVTAKHETDLANAYTNCLDICKQIEDISSVAFCGISTGVFGYPPQEAAKVAFNTVCNWLKQNQNSLDLVVFNTFSDNDNRIYKQLIGKIEGIDSD